MLLLILFISTNFSFAQIPCWEDNEICKNNEECYDNGKDDPYCQEPIVEESDNVKNWRANCSNWSINESNISSINMDIDGKCCFEWTTWNNTTTLAICDPNKLSENQNSWWGTSPTTSVMGISCNEDQLVNGQCKLNIYDTLGIRKSVRNTNDATSVGLFVQDIVLSATFFIGTLVTIALVVSGIMFIFAASSGKSPDKAKQWIIWSLIGLLIVVSSYVIIRLVQYIAKGF